MDVSVSHIGKRELPNCGVPQGRAEGPGDCAEGPSAPQQLSGGPGPRAWQVGTPLWSTWLPLSVPVAEPVLDTWWYGCPFEVVDMLA